MINVWVDKMKHSTVGSSFTVTFSAPIDELTYLFALYETYNAVNMSGFEFRTEQTEPYEYEIKALHKEWVEPKVVIEQPEPKEEWYDFRDEQEYNDRWKGRE